MATLLKFVKDSPMLAYVEKRRMQASNDVALDVRKRLGQFLTPAPIAHFMASLFTCRSKHLFLLDAGAGIGSLTAAFVDHVLALRQPPESVSVVMWEVDPEMLAHLSNVVRRCHDECHKIGIKFTAVIIPEDFTESGAKIILDRLLGKRTYAFNCAILNPPYRKIQTNSPERMALRKVGLETSNLYAGFVGLAIKLLNPGGQLVAITPRSFCNGPYFRPFRELFLREMRFRLIHTFERRDRAFADDGVLQENIVFHAVKNTRTEKRVTISYSHGAEDATLSSRMVHHDAVVSSSDPELIVHVPHSKHDEAAREKIDLERMTLVDLGINVSTGRVVDFRARKFLRMQPGIDTAPLIYPLHFERGCVTWPRLSAKKPNAIEVNDNTRYMLVPKGYYVLVKRFTSKEERRRVVAVVLDPKRITAPEFAFENHINFYHANGKGLPELLAKGLAAYLNTTTVDRYFRQFSGHTQVNASDLRKLTYPDRTALEGIGSQLGPAFLFQEGLDTLVDEELAAWRNKQQSSQSKLKAASKRLSLF